MDKKKIELLAPAGDFEKLKFAIMRLIMVLMRFILVIKILVCELILKILIMMN